MPENRHFNEKSPLPNNTFFSSKIRSKYHFSGFHHFEEIFMAGFLVSKSITNNSGSQETLPQSLRSLENCGCYQTSKFIQF